MKKKRRNYGRVKSTAFGAKLREWRKRSGIAFTQDKAARKLGIKCKNPAAYLSQIETGSKPIPDAVLLNVPRVYKVPEEEVLRQAYSPQLHFPFFAAMLENEQLWKDIKNYLKGLKLELNEKEKQEILNYATLIALKKHMTKKDKST